jgi:hypothetical protein
VIDLYQLLEKLDPQPGGEDVLRLRVGTIDAISGATVSLILSGLVIPGVPRLASAAVAVGDRVQVLTLRGSLLVIGPVANSGSSAGRGLWARGQATTSTTLTGSLASILTTNSVTFRRNRVYEIKTHGAVDAASANALADLRAYRTGPATQIGEFYRFSIPAASTQYNASGRGLYFTTANDVVGQISLYASGTGTTVRHFASAGTPRNVEVWDVGETSQFPGIPTW